MQDRSKEKKVGSEFINSIIALRKLQKKGVIPADAKLESLKTNKIKFKPLFKGLFSESNKEKLLLMSKSDLIYYGYVAESGEPQDQRGKYANIRTIDQVRNANDGVCREDSLMIYPDGSYFQGEFHQGFPEGWGILTNVESSFKYKGFFRRGLPEGLGIEEHLNAITYEGEFRSGKKNGNGKLIYEDKNYYEGEFKDNAILGYGKYFYKNFLWEGNWVDGYLEGKGKQIIAKRDLEDLNEASEYVGEFKKGEKDGVGRFKWGKGYEYDGEFKKGQLNGQGTFKFKGKLYAGVWTNGTQVKITQLRRYSDGNEGSSSINLKIPQNSAAINKKFQR